MTTRNGGPLPVRKTGPARYRRGLFSLPILLVLAACASEPDPSAGLPVQINAPQGPEQCQAQPELAWCKPHDLR